MQLFPSVGGMVKCGYSEEAAEHYKANLGQ